ncbi:hypothetical protein OF83DRAFT_1066723 [Amylostereum chailletii]|nr:hypothetical protein OF83DRAFT_1066723 [Amylostereum chailletii]
MASTSTVPSTHRAWRVVRKGAPRDALKLETDLPVPKDLQPGHVLLKVQAGALNPVCGYKLMKLLPNFLAGRPVIAEFELAGTVVEPNGTEWSKGDQVAAHLPPNLKNHQGALGEYVFAPVTNIARRPENITPTQAAGIPLAGQTAWQALFKLAQLEEGQHVFINGGSTAVGAFATQFAKAKGIRVTATASGKNEEFVKSMGADEFIDYTKQDLATYLVNNPPTTKFNAILEAVGLIDNSLYAHSEKYLAPGGVFVSVGPQPGGFGDIPKIGKLIFDLVRPTWLGGVRRKFALIGVTPSQKDMESMFELFAQGKCQPIVDSVFEFEDALKAYDRIMTKRAVGKVVVRVDPTAE